MTALPAIAFGGLVLIAYFAVRREWRSMLVADCATMVAASVALGMYWFALFWAVLGVCCWRVEIKGRT